MTRYGSQGVWLLVTLQTQSGRKEGRMKKVLLPLSLFLWYRAPSHVMVPPAFRMGLPSLIKLLRLHLIDTVLVRVSLAVVKHYDKKQLE